jgi:hypothetical protein
MGCGFMWLARLVADGCTVTIGMPLAKFLEFHVGSYQKRESGQSAEVRLGVDLIVVSKLCLASAPCSECYSSLLGL